MMELLIAMAMVICLAGILFTLFGAWVFIMLCKSLAKPADTSNRINRVRLFWFALTRPEMFAPHFAWLRNDEFDNVKS